MKKLTTNLLLLNKYLMIGACVFALGIQYTAAQTFEVTSKVNFKLVGVIDTADTFLDYAVKSTFSNTSATKTVDSFFVWEKKIVSMPKEWKNTVCDAQACAGPEVLTTMFFKGAGKTAKLDVGFITMGVAGSATVELLVYPEFKKNLAKKFVYTATINAPTAVDDAMSQLVFNKVFPNPTANDLNIDIKFKKPVNTSLVLKDMLGKTIKVLEFNQVNAINQQLNLTDVSTGLYQLYCIIDGVVVKTITVNKY